MNNIRRTLFQRNSKKVDEKIKIAIEEELICLENIAEIEQYARQIRDRRNGIVNILGNFNRNMGIIEESKGYGIPNKSRKEMISYEQVLDKIIRKRIKAKMESMYEDTLQVIAQGDTEESNKELDQIRDRQIRIDYLLDDYPGNISILQKHAQRVQIQDTDIEINKDPII